MNTVAARPPRIVHITTTDISLVLLLGPQLRAFREAGYEVIGVSAPGPHVRTLEEWGIEHVPLESATRSMDPRRDVAALVELTQLLRRLHPDLVHTHNPKPGVYGRVAARLARVPAVVNTVHGLYALPDDPIAKRVVVYGLERLAVTCSDAELVQNPEDIETMRALRFPARKLHLLGNGIDLARFDRSRMSAERRRALRDAFGATDDDVVCGLVGRLVWEKGYREVFAAANELARRAPQVKIVVVGPRDEAKSDAVTPADISRATRDGGITFLGMRDDVEELYAAMDVYVLASHREGWPRSAMEAAAMGVPLVATDIRGCRQVIDDGVTGLLVPERDASALVDAIAQLAGDRSLRRRMGEAGRDKAARDFDDRKVIDRTLAVYEQLLGPPRRSSGLVVRSATRADVGRMAELHADRLDEGFLRTLGPRFLAQLYRCVIDTDDAFAHVATLDGRVVGFSAAATDVGRLYRHFMARRGVIAAVGAAPRLLASWRQVLETLRYPSDSEELPAAEVLAVAVDAAVAGRGVGTKLIAATVAELEARGVVDAKVVTGAGNDPALALYGAAGFVHRASITVHEGVNSEVLVWSSR